MKIIVIWPLFNANNWPMIIDIDFLAGYWPMIFDKWPMNFDSDLHADYWPMNFDTELNVECEPMNFDLHADYWLLTADDAGCSFFFYCFLCVENWTISAKDVYHWKKKTLLL